MQVQEISSLLLDIHSGLGTLPDSHTIDTERILREVLRSWGVKLSDHLHLIHRLRMHGFIPLFPPQTCLLAVALNLIHGHLYLHWFCILLKGCFCFRFSG